MKLNKSAILIAPIRNVARYIEATVTHLNTVLGTVFSRVDVVLVESDSADETCARAQTLLASGRISVFESLGSLAERHPIRCDRIALARNHGIQLARDLYTPDFFIFADFDGVNNTLTAEGVASCFRYKGWSAMLANQYGRYYDIWALRHPVWCPGDCWQDYAQLLPSFGDKWAKWMAVGARQIQISAELPPIRVLSGFGGFGIYEASSIECASWSGLRPDGSEVVDWLSFNSKVNGPIFINPAMRNSGPQEHYIPLP